MSNERGWKRDHDIYQRDGGESGRAGKGQTGAKKRTRKNKKTEQKKESLGPGVTVTWVRGVLARRQPHEMPP